MNVFPQLKKLFFIGLALLVIVYCPAIFAQPQSIGQIVWVKGEIHAAAPGEASRILQRRSAIYEKDQIDSSSKATGQIVFTDGSILTISPATSFHVDQYKLNKQNPSSDKYVINVAKGGFRTITGAISKGNPEGYQVNTPVATIGVRGTDYSFYYVSCSEGKECGLSIKIIAGSIFVQNIAGQTVFTQGSNMVYGKVLAPNQAPAVTKEEPPLLRNNAHLEPAVYQSGESGQTGSGSTTIVGGESAGSSNSTSTVGSTVTTGDVPPVGNSSKPASGFCIQ